jgi:hypothetical protein
MSLEQNLQKAKQAVDYVRSRIKYSSNKGSDRLAYAGGIESVVKGKQGFDLKLIGTLDGLRQDVAIDDLEARTQRYVLSNMGNCGEMAEVAYVWLRKAGVRPIEYMHFAARSAANDHAWVMIGRDKDCDGTNLRSWGEEAVWCDPWQGQGMYYSIADLVAGKVRNLNWKYELDTVQKIEEGQPEAMYEER